MYCTHRTTILYTHTYIIHLFHFTAATSPAGSTSLCFGKSPSLCSVSSGGAQRHMMTAAGGSVECLTSSPSTDSFRSTRSGVYAATM